MDLIRKEGLRAMDVREVISTDQVPPPGGAFSVANATESLVFTAGQVGIDPATGELGAGLREQVRIAVANLERVLDASGSSLDLVLKTTCFLTDIDRFKEFDEEYRRLLPAALPARSTFGVELAGDLLFEIEAVAVRRSGNHG